MMPIVASTSMSRRSSLPATPTAIDLFAGAGGLSLGLRRAGFNVAAAVEVDPESANTYQANHPETKALVQDIRSVTAEDIRTIVNGPLDLLAGCAPCQGFCSLTRKYKDRQDPRNDLVLVMADLVKQLAPSLVLMENVPGLLTRGRSVFNRFLAVLKGAGYQASYAVLQMADFGVPQYRRRLVLVAGKGFAVSLPPPTHEKQPEKESTRQEWVTVRTALGKRRAPVTLPVSQRSGGPRAHDWHVVSELQPQTKRRLKAAIPGETWLGWKDSVRPSCHRGGYKGFTNTYGRMSWDSVAPTITGGCITPCKGRFGHPDRRRYTISVREASLLQSFPEDYAFVTESVSSACSQIGNAVPPLFAEAAGRHLTQQLQEHRSPRANKAR